MSRSARVTSIDALQTTAVALKRFRAEAASAVDELELQARRVAGWMHHDRKDYWTREMRRSEDAVAAARVQLIQARAVRRVGDREPACVDERKALARAQHRLDVALRKVEAVGRHTRAVDHAVDVFQRTRVQFLAWLEGDLEQADATLSRMSASLESYISLGAPAAEAAKNLVAGYAAQEGGEEPASEAKELPGDAEPTADRKEGG